MRSFHEIAKETLPKQGVKIVHMVMSPTGAQFLPEQKLSTDMICHWCQGTEGHAVYNDPKTGTDIVWICGNAECKTRENVSRSSTANIPAAPRKGVKWPVFCELNGIGDLHHNVKFDLMTQSAGKTDYLQKFAKKPSGIILMHGPSGTGKTYAAMATLELMTRDNPSALFYTQRTLADKWLASFKQDMGNFKSRLRTVDLLVIDDFGSGTPSPGFLTFLLDLIDFRMQWRSKGTVITTNLLPNKMSEFCGEALSDRLNTGQGFKFEGVTRRKNQDL